MQVSRKWKFENLMCCNCHLVAVTESVSRRIYPSNSGKRQIKLHTYIIKYPIKLNLINIRNDRGLHEINHEGNLWSSLKMLKLCSNNISPSINDLNNSPILQMKLQNFVRYVQTNEIIQGFLWCIIVHSKRKTTLWRV